MRLLGASDLNGRLPLDDDLVVEADNLAVLPLLSDGAFDLVYLDPPFNTGRTRSHRRIEATADPDGPRGGFGGRRYRTPASAALAYAHAPTDRSTSTSTTGRRTTASSSSTSCSAATRSSTRSSGPTTTAASPATAGRPSTTRSSSTSARRARTTSTPRRSTASPTWRRAWS